MSDTTTTYKIEGMTCGHCVSSVRAAVGRIDGVTGVEVDLATGSVAVASAQSVSDEAVKAAVDEAGYEVIS